MRSYICVRGERTGEVMTVNSLPGISLAYIQCLPVVHYLDM